MSVSVLSMQSQPGPAVTGFQSFEEARRCLTHGTTVEERVAAVRAMADFRNDLTIASLIGALFDQDEEVRRAAVEAVAGLDDPSIPARSLESLFGEDRYEKKGSVLALVPSRGLKSATLVEDLQSPDPQIRAAALSAIARARTQDAFDLITARFDDLSPNVRNAAALALCDLEPHQATKLFSRAIETAPPERQERIARALEESGLAAEAIRDLTGKDRDAAHQALCFLLLMARIKAVRPLTEGIERHGSAEVRRALVRILMLGGQSAVAEAAAKRRLGIYPTSAFNIFAGSR